MSQYEKLRREILAKPASRKIYEERFKEYLAASSLAELRRARELTQSQLAETMETTQSGISRMEHQADIYLRTLRSYIEAMGGKLEIAAVFSETKVLIQAFENLDHDDAIETRVEMEELLDA